MNETLPDAAPAVGCARLIEVAARLLAKGLDAVTTLGRACRRYSGAFGLTPIRGMSVRRADSADGGPDHPLPSEPGTQVEACRSRRCVGGH